MKRLTISLVFLYLLFGLNGCYTILPTSEESYEVTEVIVYYPVPVPIPQPVYPPVINPPYYPHPPIFVPYPEPKIRQPEQPQSGGGSGDQVRDPLRGHGERNPGPVHKQVRNDGGRR